MLRITEIYPALMGESRHSGWPCVIVRLTGCHRRCVYCDTTFSFQGGEPMAVDDVLADQGTSSLDDAFLALLANEANGARA